MTKKEEEWIKEFRKVARKMPKTIRAYVTDGSAFVCKKGVSSTDLSVDLRFTVVPCCMAIDVHDQNAEWGIDETPKE